MIRRLAHQLAIVAFTLGAGSVALAATPQQELVDKAALTAEKMIKDPELPSLRETLRQAKAVLIVPSLIKGGFILGAEGGSGVLLARGKDGSWSGPAFYTLGTGSIGLQAGVQDSEVFLVIVTEKGLNAIFDTQFKIGADASVAAGPIGGAGVSAATTAALGADIYAFAKTRGAFAGVSLEGTGVIARDAWNAAYYGKGATPRSIVIERRHSNPGAERLRQALTPK